MRAELDIPDADRELVRKWLVDGEDPIDRVIGALAEANPALTRATLARAIAEKTKIAQPTVSEILRVAFNIVQTVRNEEEIGEAILAVFNDVVKEPTDADKLDGFKRRVDRLLSLRAVVITAKALGVKFANPGSFCHARTISELRPVFSEDGLKPEAALIVHQLKITYHAGPELDDFEFFVTLGKADLEALKKVVERAISKHDQLAKIVPEGIQLL